MAPNLTVGAGLSSSLAYIIDGWLTGSYKNYG